jgi:hypothetical protein
MTYLLNFMKKFQLVQKIEGGDIETDRQTGHLISTLSFLKESRLKMEPNRKMMERLNFLVNANASILTSNHCNCNRV